MTPTDRPAPPPSSPSPVPQIPVHPGVQGDRWCLGLDLGTTALSAVLWDQDRHTTHPIFWRQPTASGTIARTFQLAVALYGRPSPNTTERSRLHPTPSIEPIALGRAALRRSRLGQEPDSGAGGQLIQHLSSALQGGIPCRVAGDPWPREPQVQDGDRPPIPLSWVIEALAALLRSLREPTPAHPWPCGAVGLGDRALHQALGQLRQVVVGQPIAATEAYRFNLREAILAADLAADPEQVIFLDQPLAAAVAQLSTPPTTVPPRTSAGPVPRLLGIDSPQPGSRLGSGSRLIIDGGASGVRLAIFEVGGTERGGARRSDRPVYTAHEFPWGGQACDLELVVQHFAARLVAQFPDLPNLAHPPGFDPALQGRSLRVLLRSDAGRRSLAAIEQLRMQLQQRPVHPMPVPQVPPVAWSGHGLAHDSVHGWAKPLATQAAVPPSVSPVATFELAGQTWTLDDDTWSRIIVQPWLARFNQELNHLLCRSGCPTERITQIVWVGGFGPMPAVRDWLRQKFPGATWIHPPHRSRDTSSAIAHGLARISQFPTLLTHTEQPYSDYFLWVELLSALPTDQPLPEYQIRHILNGRGINVRACGDRLRALLRGKLPTGLVPPAPHPTAVPPHSRWAIAPLSQVHPLYVALRSTPLFSQDAHGNYWMDGNMASQWRRYVGRLLVRSHQPFQEPCFPGLAAGWAEGQAQAWGDRWTGDQMGDWSSDWPGDRVGDRMGDRVRDSVGDSVRDSVGEQICPNPSLP